MLTIIWLYFLWTQCIYNFNMTDGSVYRASTEHNGIFWRKSDYLGAYLVTERLRVRLTPGSLQATLSKLLTYCVLRPTQPPILSVTGNE